MQIRRESGPWVRPATLLVATLALVALPSVALTESLQPKQQPPSRGFIENRGQIDDAVRFYAAGDRSAVYFTPEGPVIEVRQILAEDGTVSEPIPNHLTRRREHRALPRARRFSMAVRFVDSRPSIEVTGVGELPSRYNYLTGKDREDWRVDLSAYERVVYHDVWPGVDLIYRLAGDGLFYEISARPGADLERVKFHYEGVKEVRERHGVRRLETPLGGIEDRPPVSGVGVGMLRVTNDTVASAETASVEMAAAEQADPQSPALAPGDPMLGMDLWWSTFLGGNRDDSVYAIAVDDEARPIVTGTTISTDYPTTIGVVQPDYNASFEAFVTKFDYDGSTVLWSTYLGGSNDDRGWTMGIDHLGRPVVAGVTSSPDFPVTAGAYDTSYNGDYDAFVTKLSADGTAIIWSSFFGGSDREWDVSGIDLDATDRPVFTGSTRSDDLPFSVGAFGDSLNGTQDAFVASLSTDGDALSFSTYLGGADSDIGEDVALDSAALTVVLGSTSSADFPVTAGALQETPGGARDVFVAKLAADASSLVFSTYLGGGDDDDGYAVVLDDSDRPIVTGATTSSDFPTTPGAYGPSYTGGRDAFVTRLAADGSAQIWGTYFGGTGEEKGLDIVRDSEDRPIFAGFTCSSDFPLVGPPLNEDFFACDGFLTRLSADGSFALFSSYLGGWRDDSVFGLARTELDRVVAGGETFSSNFPATSNAYDPTHNSPDDWYDGFVTQVLTPRFCSFISGTTDPQLLMAKAVEGVCPEGTPEDQLIDLVEGQLENLGADDVGVVRRIGCNSAAVVLASDITPPPGLGRFQIARFKPDGTYIDGAETGLVGDRTIVDGDCP